MIEHMCLYFKRPESPGGFRADFPLYHQGFGDQMSLTCVPESPYASIDRLSGLGGVGEECGVRECGEEEEDLSSFSTEFGTRVIHGLRKRLRATVLNNGILWHSNS